jgi:hypothetical protein
MVTSILDNLADTICMVGKKMEVIGSSETLVTTHKTTHCSQKTTFLTFISIKTSDTVFEGYL